MRKRILITNKQHLDIILQIDKHYFSKKENACEMFKKYNDLFITIQKMETKLKYFLHLSLKEIKQINRYLKSIAENADMIFVINNSEWKFHYLNKTQKHIALFFEYCSIKKIQIVDRKKVKDYE